MRKHRIWAWAAAVALAAPVAAVAQVEAVREQRFRELDKNGDGVISRDEYDGHPGNFRAIDANGDGVLSHDEFVNRYRQGNENAPPVAAQPPEVTSAAPAAPVPDTFATMDRNGDGVLTRSEWRANLAPGSFARLDRNHDGLVTRDEFVSPLPVGSAEARFGDLDRNNNGVINRGEWRGQSLPFDLVDRNRDGRITVDEYVNAPAASNALETRFAQLDTNGDGVLSRREWRGETVPFRQADLDGDGVVTSSEYMEMGVIVEQPLGTGTRADQFRTLDRNGNGEISRGEWPYDRRQFDTLDRNGDGVLTLREYQNAPVSYQEPYSYGSSSRATDFRDLDRDGNGYIDRREWPYDRAEFDRLDRDGDGRLTRSEYQDAQGSTSTQDYEFRRLDVNGDGVISRREWSGSAGSFADYDRNGDGVISRREFFNYSY